MIVIGIILIVLGLVLGAFVVAGSLLGDAGSDVVFSVFGLTVQTSLVVVFALGALTLLLLELGVLALRSGARKSSKRRAELQRLRRVEAEVQARQASDSQRNATTSAAATPASPAPFARRDPDPSARSSTTDGSSTDRSTSDRSSTDRSSTDRSHSNDTAVDDTAGGRSDDTTAYTAVDASDTTAPASTRPPEPGSSSGSESGSGSGSTVTGQPSNADRS